MITLQQLLGLCDANIDYDFFEVPVNKQAIPTLKKLRQDASDAGFDMAFASGYRSFGRQKGIWNAKARGERTILNHKGVPINMTHIQPNELLMHILYWSALPGGSRHHWGTEVDIYDKAALGRQQLGLTVEETVKGGVFEKMYLWLDDYLLHNTVLRRPYMTGVGRVAKEPWHLSVIKAAESYEALMTLDTLKKHMLSQEGLELRNDIVEQFDDIYMHYIAPYNIA